MKKQKNPLRPEGSCDRKNCPHLTNQPLGAQPVFSIPESEDWQHTAQHWDEQATRPVAGGRRVMAQGARGGSLPPGYLKLVLFLAHSWGGGCQCPTVPTPVPESAPLGTRVLGVVLAHTWPLTGAFMGKPGLSLQAGFTCSGQQGTRLCSQLPRFPSHLPSARVGSLPCMPPGISFETRASQLKKALKSPWIPELVAPELLPSPSSFLLPSHLESQPLQHKFPPHLPGAKLLFLICRLTFSSGRG